MQNTIDELWTIEQALWTDGTAAYERVLDANCVMALPGMGLMDRDMVLRSLDGAPRWDAVAMDDKKVIRADGVVIIAYQATGRRGDTPPYRASCISSYRLEGDRWHMLSHQQTPSSD